MPPIDHNDYKRRMKLDAKKELRAELVNSMMKDRQAVERLNKEIKELEE